MIVSFSGFCGSIDITTKRLRRSLLYLHQLLAFSMPNGGHYESDDDRRSRSPPVGWRALAPSDRSSCQARCGVKVMLGNGPPWPSCGRRCCLRECHLRVSQPLAPLPIDMMTLACSPQCYCHRCWTIIHALHDTRQRSTEDEAAEQRRRAEHAARDSSLSSRLCDIRQRSTEANGVPEGGIVTH